MSAEKDPSGKAADFLELLRRQIPGSGMSPGTWRAEADPRPVMPEEAAPLPPSPPGLEALISAGLQAQELRLRRVEAELDGPPTRAEGPPQPPSELVAYLQARLEAVESRLQAAEEEAARASLLLRERERSQREARQEAEELFHSLREQSRASAWDARLREQLQVSQRRVDELKMRLLRTERASIPAQEARRLLEAPGGREELLRRLRDEEGRGFPAAAPIPAAPAPETPGCTDAGTLALLMGRLADLERRLEEARREKEQETARRLAWEREALEGASGAERDWRRRGGPRLAVEASLDSVGSDFRDREALASELDGLLGRLELEPDSPDAPAWRERLARAREKMQGLQERIDRQMPLIQAWLRQGAQAPASPER